MKKISCILISLILILAFGVSAFADTHLIDPVTGEVIDEYGNSSTSVRLTATCKYDKTDKMYVYTIGTTDAASVRCSVFNGMVTTNTVSIEKGASAKIEVYRNGELVSTDNYSNLSQPGSYVVNNTLTSEEVLSFTIVPYLTNSISSYKVPAIFYIANVKFNDEEMPVESNLVRFDKDGIYHIEYVGNKTGVGYTLDVHVDQEYPELEIIGLDEDGIARGPVTFGELEGGSTLTVTVNGEPVKALDDIYKTAGSYVVKYQDAAGNVSTYYFTMNIFFDFSAWLFVGIVVVVIIVAYAFMRYTHRHRRVR